MAKLEDILFWVLILAVIGIALWLAFGSPEFEGSMLAIIIFAATSEIMLWRAFFAIDKRTAIGFEKVRSEFLAVNNKLECMDNRLPSMEKNINEIKHYLKNK